MNSLEITNPTGVLQIPQELRYIIAEEFARDIGIEEAQALRASCCFVHHHTNFYRNGLPSLAGVKAFKSASEVAVKGCSRIPILLSKPDGARYRSVLGCGVLGEATLSREGCKIWYGRTSQN